MEQLAGVILASTSPFRRSLMKRLRLPFDCVDPEFEEIEPPSEGASAESVRRLVLENARGKGMSVASRHPRHLVISSDQLGLCGSTVLRKPLAAEAARAQLRFLAGREHQLHTAVVATVAARAWSSARIVTSTLVMRPLTEARVARYVELEQPLQSAGSYHSEALGIALFEAIRGDDPTAVIGLPLIATCRLLEEAGIHPLGPDEAAIDPPGPGEA